MPGSYDFFNDYVKTFVNDRFPKGSDILDVGPGAGKYGKMFKSNFNVDAVEVFSPYVEAYELKSIYSNVYIQDICDFEFPEGKYNLIIMGDILEHLHVEAAQKLLERLYSKKAALLILVPYDYHQGVSHGNIHEVHHQPDLTEDLFHARYPGFKKIFGNNLQGVFFKASEG